MLCDGMRPVTAALPLRYEPCAKRCQAGLGGEFAEAMTADGLRPETATALRQHVDFPFDIRVKIEKETVLVNGTIVHRLMVWSREDGAAMRTIALAVLSARDHPYLKAQVIDCRNQSFHDPEWRGYLDWQNVPHTALTFVIAPDVLPPAAAARCKDYILSCLDLGPVVLVTKGLASADGWDDYLGARPVALPVVQ